MARFNTLGARPWSRLATAQLVATTGRETTTPRPPVHELLSARELRVALRVAEGDTNREVAAALFFSPKTVEVHLTRIYKTLGVRSRTVSPTSARPAMPRIDSTG